jgi:CubicO group peptidase (beta-lactamase class C family)
VSEFRKPFGPFSRLSAIPRDLASVTTTGEEDDPADTGIPRDSVTALWKAVERLYASGLHPAVQVCIRRRGLRVLNRAIGHARGNAPDDPRDAPKEPATPATPFVMYSASKGVTAMVILKLDEMGKLHVEDRVADWVPEFRRHGKDAITIRHILTHKAGIPTVPPEADFLNHPEEALALLCDSRPRWRPGRVLSYHAISGGYVLAAVAERATGKSIRETLRQEIAEPLGLRWMSYGVRPEEVSEVADDAATGPPAIPPGSWLIRRALGDSIEGVVATANGPLFRTALVPSGNVITTADELSRFYACLANYGELDGTRVFDRRTIRRATAEQSFYELDLTLGAPLRWGLGLMLGGPVSLFGLDASRAFGHLGFTNIVAWADPERELGVAIVNSGKPFLSLGVVPLASLIVRISRTFPKRQR